VFVVVKGLLLNLYCDDLFDENMNLFLASVIETLVVMRVTSLNVLNGGKLTSLMISVTSFGPLYDYIGNLRMCLLGKFITYAFRNYLRT
jgi:hypothetical protein